MSLRTEIHEPVHHGDIVFVALFTEYATRQSHLIRDDTRAE